MQTTFTLEINQETIEFPTIDICPICHFSIFPFVLSHHLKTFSYSQTIAVFFQCRKCKDVFMGLYELEESCRTFSVLLKSLSPQYFKPFEFDQTIQELSPKFVMIYNQALEADKRGLGEISGMAYRKALEFLVKDYLCSENPDETETIKSLPLAKCINTYINNANIKTLAEKSAWIGNDETHYVRKHTDYDVNTLKKFIDALVYFISMEITVKESLELTKK